MKKIWEKNTKEKSLKIIDEYCFQEGVGCDNKLVEHDVLGSIAHAQMLYKINVLSYEEFIKLKKTLISIIDQYKKGLFVVKPADEDVHTKIESYLIEKLGETGKKIHTARSRNDQVLTDLRLFAKNQLLDLFKQGYQLVNTFLLTAQKYQFIPMPGYTHMQKAMPSSTGLWLGSFAESLFDDLVLLKTAYKLNDQSPLGSGAAYGVPLPVDRVLTASLLGFSKVQNNSLYCQASRPKIQLAIIQALVQVMLTLSKFAQDLLLFTTSEFNFFTVDDKFFSGSSIMPQKKNLDPMEYLRAKTHTVIGHQQIVASIGAGLPSGYSADFGETKKPFMEAIEIILKTLPIVKLIVPSIKPNIKILKKTCTKELLATYSAYELVKKGVTFRDAYKKIAADLNSINQVDIVDILKQTNHIGGPGNLGFKKILGKLENEKNWLTKQQNQLKKSINQLIK